MFVIADAVAVACNLTGICLNHCSGQQYLLLDIIIYYVGLHHALKYCNIILCYAVRSCLSSIWKAVWATSLHKGPTDEGSHHNLPRWGMAIGAASTEVVRQVNHVNK